MTQIVPIQPTEVLPAIHPDHQQGSYGQIVQLCHAQAYGELAQMLQGYRTFLTQEFNRGSIATNPSQHSAIVGNIIALQNRAGELAAAVQHNTSAVADNTAQLGLNTQQLTRLNDNLETYFYQQQTQLPPQPTNVYIVNEVHGHGGGGGRATADSTSESKSNSDGGSWGGFELLSFVLALLVFLSAIAATANYGRSRERQQVPASAPTQSLPRGGLSL